MDGSGSPFSLTPARDGALVPQGRCPRFRQGRCPRFRERQRANLGETPVEAKRDVYSALLYDGTTYTDVSAPGYVDSYATGINNTGDVLIIVDKEQNRKEIEEGAILHAGNYTFFTYKNNPAALTSAFAINDRHQIVGGYEVDNTHQFLLGGFEATF